MDKKAKKILLTTYWKNGWIDSKERVLSEEDFLYAKSKGLMFDPLTITHDECIDGVIGLVNKLSKEQVVKGFLSSLTSNRLDWRSSLASYAIAKKVFKHTYTPEISGTSYVNNQPVSHSYSCAICRDCGLIVTAGDKDENFDLNVLNFERIKWGGVRLGKLLYTYFDLKTFAEATISEPTNDDIKCLKDILSIIASSELDDTPNVLAKRLAPVIKSNQEQRRVLIEILACIGTLKPASTNRPSHSRSDWVFAEFWRGEDSFCQATVNTYFGQYL